MKENLQIEEITILKIVLGEASSATSSDQENMEIQCVIAEKGVQCYIPTLRKFSVEGMKHNSKMISYYNGFNRYDNFMFILNILDPAAFDLKNKCVCFEYPQDQLFFTLIKLRAAKVWNMPCFLMFVNKNCLHY